MSFLFLPTEIHLEVVKELSAETKFALTAASGYLRLLIFRKDDVPTLIKNAMIDLEYRRAPAASLSGQKKQRSWEKLPYYTYLKIPSPSPLCIDRLLLH